MLGGRAAARRRRSTASRCDGRERTGELANALVATGFGYEADVRAAQAEISGRLLPRVRDIRRLGSSAIDLAWTAAGRYDAYYERGVKLWDYRRRRADLRDAPGSRRGTWSRRRPWRAGILVAPVALADELASLVD